MIEYGLPFAISFIAVFFKAAQQLNVMHHKIWLVPPVSLGMAFCEVVLIGFIAIKAVGSMSLFEAALLILILAAGGSLGAILSMVMHKRLREKGEG